MGESLPAEVQRLLEPALALGEHGRVPVEPGLTTTAAGLLRCRDELARPDRRVELVPEVTVGRHHRGRQHEVVVRPLEALAATRLQGLFPDADGPVQVTGRGMAVAQVCRHTRHGDVRCAAAREFEQWRQGADRRGQVTRTLVSARQQQRGLGPVPCQELGLVEERAQTGDRVRRRVVAQGQLRVGELELHPALALRGLTVEELARRAPQLGCELRSDGRARAATVGLQERHVAGRDPVAGELGLGQSGRPP